MEKNEILSILNDRCKAEIENYETRVSLCLDIVDKMRCPAEFADPRLFSEVQSIIEDLVEWDLDEEDENEREVIDYLNNEFTFDDLIFFCE